MTRPSITSTLRTAALSTPSGYAFVFDDDEVKMYRTECLPRHSRTAEPW